MFNIVFIIVFNIWFNIWFNIVFTIGFNIGFNVELNIGFNFWFNIWLNIWFNIGSNIGFNIGLYCLQCCYACNQCNIETTSTVLPHPCNAVLPATPHFKMATRASKMATSVWKGGLILCHFEQFLLNKCFDLSSLFMVKGHNRDWKMGNVK